MSNLIIIDAAEQLSRPAPPILWAIDGLLPVGTLGDVFGPPGEGKSSLTLDLAINVAAGTGVWYGHKCFDGRVVILGGERSGTDSFCRDLHRAANGRTIPQGNLVMPQNNHGDFPPMWAWRRDENGDFHWVMTKWGREITEWLTAVKPILILIDTLISVAENCNIIDQPQQYALGIAIQNWQREIGSPTILTISHTNQASNQNDLNMRINYLSRAGGNGYPAKIRWIAGLSRLRPDDNLAVKLQIEDQARDKKLICFGASKGNEMPTAVWNNYNPAIFEMTQSGSVLMVMDGQEVKDKMAKSDTQKEDSKKDKKNNKYAKNSQNLGGSTDDTGDSEMPFGWAV